MHRRAAVAGQLLRRLSSTASPIRRATKPMVVGEHTVPTVHERPSNLAQLERDLGALRARHPGAIIDRYLDKVPSIADDVLVCPGAAVIGDVRISQAASVWYGAVLRGDMNYVCTAPQRVFPPIPGMAAHSTV
jgi:hypothetical protein